MVELLGYALVFLLGAFMGMAMMAILCISADAEDRSRRMRND